MKLIVIVLIAVAVIVTALEDSQLQDPPTSNTTSTTRKLVRKIKKINPDNEQKLTSSLQSSKSLSKLNSSLYRARNQSSTFSKLRSRLGQLQLASTTTPQSHLLIPIPSSQQKPYQPVIMQVDGSKNDTNSSVITYKLNKMFTPLGIYGRVSDDERGKKELRPADLVSLTYDKPDVSKISLTTEATRTEDIQLTHENPNRRYTQSIMPPPVPLPKESSKPVGLFQTIRNKVSSVDIPGMLHMGLTSLGQQSNYWKGVSSGDMEEASSEPAYTTVGKVKPGNVVVAVPGGSLPENIESDSHRKSVQQQQQQSLEYFRRRPHLRALQKPHLTQNWLPYLFPTPSHSYLREVFDLTSTPKNPNLDNLWSEIRRKYSLEELDHAKKRAYGVFQGDVTSTRAGKSEGRAFGDVMAFFQRVYQHQQKQQQQQQIKQTQHHQKIKKSDDIETTQQWRPVEPQNLSRHIQSSAMANYYKPKPKPTASYEIIPRDLYLQQKDAYELAAIVKPHGLSDQEAVAEITKNSATEAERRAVPVLSYGSKHSLDQVAAYLTSRKDVTVTESKLLDPYDYHHHHDTPTSTATPTLVDISPVFHPPTTTAAAPFFQTQLYENLLRSTVPQPKKFYKEEKPVTKFFAPIPIGGGIIKKSRYGSGAVPKFVVELARKLKTDRDVQGIVRVSRRDKSGKMVEFLYPVRGR